MGLCQARPTADDTHDKHSVQAIRIHQHGTMWEQASGEVEQSPWLGLQRIYVKPQRTNQTGGMGQGKGVISRGLSVYGERQ